MFTKEEYVDWRQNRVTKALIKALAENRQGRLDEIGDAKVRGEDLLMAMGQTQGIKDSVEFMLNMNGELTEFILVETEDDKTDSEA